MFLNTNIFFFNYFSRSTYTTRRVQKVKIHHVYADRKIFMLIISTLPSTLILYLWAVLVWQFYNRLCLSETCLKWQRRSKSPTNCEVRSVIRFLNAKGESTGRRWVSGLHCDWRWNMGCYLDHFNSKVSKSLSCVTPDFFPFYRHHLFFASFILL